MFFDDPINLFFVSGKDQTNHRHYVFICLLHVTRILLVHTVSFFAVFAYLCGLCVKHSWLRISALVSFWLLDP